MAEYIGLSEEEALEHKGVKGTKWGYTKGARNGKRTAGQMSTELAEGYAKDTARKTLGDSKMNSNLAFKNREKGRKQREAKRVRTRNSNAQSKGRSAKAAARAKSEINRVLKGRRRQVRRD